MTTAAGSEAAYRRALRAAKRATRAKVKCAGCDLRFRPTRADALYHSPACKQRAYRERILPAMTAPFADDLKRAREQAQQPIDSELASVRRLAGELQSCRDVMTNVKAGTLLKRAQRNLELAQRELR
jgi:hypothetical protein